MKKMALVLVIAVSVSAFGQKKHVKKHEPSEGSIRSFVQLFTELEDDCAVALQRHDTTALEEFLAPEFIVRSAADPERIIDRGEWLRTIVPKSQINSFNQTDINVRVFPGDVALVSFVESRKRSTSAKPSTLLVVDVWTANHATNKWELVQRYQSTATSR